MACLSFAGLSIVFTYNTNDAIPLTSVGEGTDAVICMTTRTYCCTNALSETRNGEWYYPIGDMVPTTGANEDLYRNRGTQQVILNRRNNAMSVVTLEQFMSMLSIVFCPASALRYSS